MKLQIYSLRVFLIIIFSTISFLEYSNSIDSFTFEYSNLVEVSDAPIVTLLSPVTGSTYLIGEDISMSANASDPDGFVVKVMFYAGNTFLGEDVSAPYEYKWLKPSEGNYAITAKAIDNDGDTTTSNISNIVVIDEGQPGEWVHSGLGGGGAMFSPSISPFDNKEIYIACDMSGIYNSKDEGESWDLLDFRQIRANIESKINFTSSPDTLYSIANYPWPNERTPVKSIDGGKTWSGLTGDPTSAETYYLFADPNSTKRVILSSYSELYYSDDGGASFTQIYTANDLYVGGVFWDGNDIFIGCIDGLLTSHDNGNSFNLENFNDEMPANFGILTLTGAKQDGNARLFCVARLSGDMWPDLNPVDYWSDEADVFRLNYPDNNGWKRANNGINSGDFPYFVAMAADDIDIVYMAGADENGANKIVYKSSDGGNSWANTFLTTNNQNIATGWMGDNGDLDWSWAESILGIDVCPNNPDIVVVTDWGFAHTSRNGGNSWQQIYVPQNESNPPGSQTPKGLDYHSNGLEVTSSWWLTWIDKDSIFASYTDFTGIKSADGGKSWNKNYSGNDYNSTYQVVKRADTGKLFAAVSSIHDLYQSTYLEDSRIDGGTGAILQSDDNGFTWSMLYDFGHPVVWIALSPNDSDKMYASVVHSTDGGIFYSSDSGANWSKLSNPPRTEGHPFNIRILSDNTLVCSYSGRINSSGDFTESSGVFYSTDNGTTWYDRYHPDMYRWTKDVIIDPHDPAQNTWYACVFSHWGHYPNEVGGVFKTTDRGVNWTRLNNLYRVNSLSIHPDFPDIAYITTETQGLWYSSDISQSNPGFMQLNFPFAQPMRIFFNPYDHNEVWATSFGTGILKGTTRLGRTFYVSTTGNDNNSGTSEAQAWRTITYAASAASPVAPGDTVYIKAGNYGNENVVFEKSGTGISHIIFAGYQNTPGDNPDLEHQFGDPLDPAIMPLLNGGNRTTGVAIALYSQKFIDLKSIQLTSYEQGIDGWNASNITLENITATDFGDVSDSYDGSGFTFSPDDDGNGGDNNILKDCFIENAAAEGISIVGDSNKILNCKVYCDQNAGNAAMDYYIVLEGNNNILDSCYAERIGNLDHDGHGIGFKGNCENNLVKNSTAKNLGGGFYVRHRGCKNNVFSKCTIQGLYGFAVRDGASYNTFKGCKAINTLSAILFYDTGEDEGAQYAGRHNVFENCLFQNTSENVIDFFYYELESICDSNTIINCVIDGGDYLFNCDRSNNHNKLVNSIITNVQNYYRTAYHQGVSYPLNIDISYSDFFNNGFSAPSGTAIMTFDPKFINISAHDYHLQSISQCIDNGIEMNAPLIDLDSVPRPLLHTIDLGAYEFGIYWIGKESNMWHTSGNWSNSTIPNSNDSVTIPPREYYKYHPEVNSDVDIKKLFLYDNSKMKIKSNVLFNVIN